MDPRLKKIAKWNPKMTLAVFRDHTVDGHSNGSMSELLDAGFGLLLFFDRWDIIHIGTFLFVNLLAGL